MVLVPHYVSHGPFPHQAAAQVAQRGHVALTCVLDRSGSMDGEPLRLVKETCHFLIDQLSQDDYLGAL